VLKRLLFIDQNQIGLQGGSSTADPPFDQKYQNERPDPHIRFKNIL